MQQVLDPFRFVFIVLAGWVDQLEQDIHDYVKEENRVLREHLGNKRLRLNDEQRRRLAVRAKKLGHKVLGEVASIVTSGGGRSHPVQERCDRSRHGRRRVGTIAVMSRC